MVSTAQPNLAYMAAQPQHMGYASNDIYTQPSFYPRNLYYPRNYGMKIPRQPVYTYPKYHKKFTPSNAYNRTRKVNRNFPFQNSYSRNAANFVAPASSEDGKEEEKAENQNSASATENEDSETSSNKKTAMTLLNELARYNKVI